MNRLTRNLLIALIASAIFNVFIAGVWAGRFVRRNRNPGAPFEGNAEMSAPMRGVWRRHDATLGPKREAVEAARRAVRDALVADPFNPQAMEGALAQLRTETDSAQVELHRSLVEAARDLGPEDRRRMASSRLFMGPGSHRGPGPH